MAMQEFDPQEDLEFPVEVRALTAGDLDWVVRIDEAHAGRSRRAYFEVKMREAQSDTGLRMSLAATVDGEPAGFLMARLYYGEFGLPEPAAILDSIGVDQERTGHHVGRALVHQLVTNLKGLGIERLQTEVEWDQIELLRFFHHAGFAPAPRLCLEMRLTPKY